MIRSRTLLMLASSALVAAAGCGGGGPANVSESTVPGGPTLTVRAKEPYAYDQKSYTAKAGTINVELINDGKENHNLVVSGVSTKAFKLTVTAGQTQVGAVTLKAGTYTIFCDLTGHRSGGMEAKLVVS